ncbi:MAG TPA: hypothetical protein PLO44_03070 [Candidatus Paceibacterota bacterium]|nr:hypothetical protein [Candidatus Paceibacterota bacterium]
MKKRVGILRGGEHDYENSLAKGGELILHITEKLGDKWQVFDIFIDKDNVWHLTGKEIKPADLMHKVDVVWNVSLPSYTNVLQSFAIPYVGADVFHNTVIQNRAMLEEHMKKVGIKMPRHLVIPIYQKDFDGEKETFILKKAKEVHEKFAAPWIVKSFAQHSDMGIHIAKTFPELIESIADCINHGESILVEEFISGKNISTHSVAGFRNQDTYVFPNIENISKIEKENIMKAAEQLHKHFNNPKYLRSEFVLDLRGKVFLKNIQFNPELNKDSHFCQTCNYVGANPQDVVACILDSVL